MVKKKFLVIAVNALMVLLILIIINLLIFVFNSKIVSQKNFKRSYLSYMPISYQVYYPSTNDGTFKNYTAILGDSHALGVGEGYFDLNEENYSIAHILKKLNPNKNYITFAWPGGGSISILKLFRFHTENLIYRRISEKPNQIIYLFTEENDFTDDYNDKYLNKIQYAFTKKEYVKSIFPLFYYSYLSINLYKTNVQSSNLINNTFLFKKKEINFNNRVGGISVPEITAEQQKKTLDIIYYNLSQLRKQTEKMYVFYVPSSATIYDMKSPIKALSFRDKKNIQISKKDMDQYNKDSVKQIEDLCKKLNIEFINLTYDLKRKAETDLIHGPEDWGHFNMIGQQTISKIINSKIN
jgi:hypothetical protein